MRKGKKNIQSFDPFMTKIPNLESLNEENKEKVQSFLNDINIYNYKSVLKYSEIIVEKTNRDIDLLFYKINELEGILKSIKSMKELPKKPIKKERSIYDRYPFLRWSNSLFFVLPRRESTPDYTHRDYYNEVIYKVRRLQEEIKVLLAGIGETEKLAELKIIAFNEFIKQENKRKYDLNNEFDKAEKLLYARHKKSIIEERERLRKLLALVRRNMFNACCASLMPEYERKLENIEKYIIYGLEDLGPKECVWEKHDVDPLDEKNDMHFYTLYVHARTYNKKSSYFKKYCEEDNAKALETDFDNMIELIKNIQKYGFQTTDVNTLKTIRDSIHNKSLWPGSFDYKELLHIYAIHRAAADIFIYDRRKEIPAFIKDMREFVKRYESIPPVEWDKEQMTEQIKRYTNMCEQYIGLCLKYLPQSLIEEMRSAIYDVNYLSYSLKNERENQVITSLSTAALYYNFDINLPSDSPYMRYHLEPELVHYDNKAFELLEAIEKKYNVSFGTPHAKRMIVKELVKKGTLSTLYELLAFDVGHKYLFETICGATSANAKVTMYPKGRVGYVINSGISDIGRKLRRN